MKQFILHADVHSTLILNHIMNIRCVHVHARGELRIGYWGAQDAERGL